MLATNITKAPTDLISINLQTDSQASLLGGIVSWDELDEIWDMVLQSSDAGWYLHTPDNLQVDAVSSAGEVKSLVALLKSYLQPIQERKYCGIVYVDSFTEPTLIRVFDPKELTSMCNISGNIPGPSWVFTKKTPKQLAERKEAPSKFEHQDLGKTLPSVIKHPQAIAVLDARKMGCPLPLVNTARALRQIEVGEWLQVVSFEPSAVNDVASICEFTGHKHIAQLSAEYGYSFFIQRMHKLKRLPT